MNGQQNWPTLCTELLSQPLDLLLQMNHDNRITKVRLKLCASRLVARGAIMEVDTSDGDYHRAHPFTLPLPGVAIISPITGTTYQFGRVLGEGAFSFVFECADEWQQPLVAKVIRPEPQWEETEKRAFDEALAMAIARSPNIVHVHDTFVYRGAYIIISERCHGSMRDLLSSPNLDLNVWFAAVARAVLNGLHWMHINGIAHCDVHPGNVFVQCKADALESLQAANSIFQVKLGDLGLARPIENMIVEGTFLEAWRPPEAIDSEFGPIDHRADIYQAGLLFLSLFLQKELRFTAEEIGLLAELSGCTGRAAA